MHHLEPLAELLGEPGQGAGDAVREHSVHAEDERTHPLGMRREQEHQPRERPQPRRHQQRPRAGWAAATKQEYPSQGRPPRIHREQHQHGHHVEHTFEHDRRETAMSALSLSCLASRYGRAPRRHVQAAETMRQIRHGAAKRDSKPRRTNSGPSRYCQRHARSPVDDIVSKNDSHGQQIDARAAHR